MLLPPHLSRLQQTELRVGAHLDRAATARAYKRRDAQQATFAATIDTAEVGRSGLICAAIPNVGDLPGTLAPPTPRQVEAKYDWIRESNPDGVTELIVTYTFGGPFGTSEARIAVDADENYLLVDGREISVLDLYRGMSVLMADGSVGTLLGHPERR